jgi:hypothetical protein
MVKISLRRGFHSVDWETRRRQREYAEKAAHGRKELLTRRMGRLPDPKPFGTAMQALRQVSRPGKGSPTEVVLRSQLVRREVPRVRDGVLPRSGAPGRSEALTDHHRNDRNTRPPAAQIVRSRHGLSLILLSYYLARATTNPGTAPSNPFELLDGDPNWSSLIGLHGVPRAARRKRVVRALIELQLAGLVGLGAKGGNARYERFSLLSELPGSDRAYTVPGEKFAGGFALPAAFWWNGWHLVLEPGEVLTLLMFTELAAYFSDVHEDVGVGASETVRWGHYGVSGEVYGHHRTLTALGLLERVTDGVAHRDEGKVNVNKHGKPREVYRFKVRPEGLEVDTRLGALPVVQERLQGIIEQL